MLDYTAPTYELAGNCLRISGEHGPDSEDRFEEALNRLLESRSRPMFVDMTAVTYISSGYVRILAVAVLQARNANSELIIKANKRVRRLLQMGGIDQIGTVELVTGD